MGNPRNHGFQLSTRNGLMTWMIWGTPDFRKPPYSGIFWGTFGGSVWVFYFGFTLQQSNIVLDHLWIIYQMKPPFIVDLIHGIYREVHWWYPYSHKFPLFLGHGSSMWGLWEWGSHHWGPYNFHQFNRDLHNGDIMGYNDDVKGNVLEINLFWIC